MDSRSIFFFFLALHVTLSGMAAPSFSRATGEDTLAPPRKNTGAVVTVKERKPKHYLFNTIYTEFYTTPKRVIQTENNLKLGEYKFTEQNTGFYFPIRTRDIHRDSNTIANVHTLFVGNFLKSTPHFDSITKDHHLNRGSLGIRVLYNNGKKSVWFFNFAPYWTQDERSPYRPSGHFSSMIVYNRTHSRYFSWRLGVTRTFIFGNKHLLPVAGLRIGPLDGTYLSVQFPRNISINFPVGRKFYGSFYCKPFGGVYSFMNRDTFSNGDSLYTGRDSMLRFGRREFILGTKLEFNASRNFSFFVSSGLSALNRIWFFSHSYNTDRNSLLTLKPFYNGKLSNTYFVNIGLTWRFGKVKNAYNNYTMYDLMDMNNSIDPGDVNDGPGNGSIPNPRTTTKDVQYRDVQDLIELQDDF
jgi:hypothetical protein